jgi:hypothetical protein
VEVERQVEAGQIRPVISHQLVDWEVSLADHEAIRIGVSDSTHRPDGAQTRSSSFATLAVKLKRAILAVTSPWKHLAPPYETTRFRKPGSETSQRRAHRPV